MIAHRRVKTGVCVQKSMVVAIRGLGASAARVDLPSVLEPCAREKGSRSRGPPLGGPGLSFLCRDTIVTLLALVARHHPVVHLITPYRYLLKFPTKLLESSV